jgi:hypothetical protein
MRRLVTAIIVAALPLTVSAQGRGGQAAGGRGAAPPPPPPTGRAGAIVDFTGYWVSLVTDDWRYRMLTPPKGNVDYLPVTPEARRVANEWDPARDEAAGEQCRAYGAVGVMRLPGRLHITWESDTVMKLETDAGTQTRRFSFDQPIAASVEPSWQGVSAAQWVRPANRALPAGPPAQGELKVVTTKMRPGYIRKNGVPYSANAVLTENFVRLVDDDGTQYLALTQMLEDPVYLVQPIIRTMMFRKQVDGAGWNPTPCSAR